VLKIL
jgi:hypothetical protein